jgi:hypothetical protein
MHRALIPLVPLVATAIGLAAVGPAGSAAGPSGPPGSDQARPTHHRIVDPVRDVYLLLENPDGSDAGFARRPHVRNGDITSAIVRHRSAAANVTVRLAKLRRPGTFAFTIVSLRTAQDTWNTTLYNHSGDSTPEIFFDRDSGGEANCPRASARISYSKDVVRIRVPRACMDNPAWVRPSVAMITAPRDAAGALRIDVAPGAKPLDRPQFGAKVWHARR